MIRTITLLTFIIISTLSFSQINEQGNNIDQNSPSMEEIKMYPNPVSDDLTIDIERGFCTVFIINVIGKEVFRENNLEGRHQINVSILQNGVYYVSFQDRLGKIIRSERLVVER